MNAIILQPPIVQLNTPYPSGAYLSAFFKRQKFEWVKWIDLNILFMNSIFSSEGLRKIFSQTEEKAISIGEESTRYILQKDSWINSIDSIMAVLRGDAQEAHKLIYSPHMPRGMHMERFLETVENLNQDSARMLATFALADIADYITCVMDSNFSLVRYAESIALSETSFSQIEKTVDSPILSSFLVPLLEKIFLESELKKQIEENKEKTLVCISVPFAGTFTSALCIGKFLKKYFADKILISMGGGFINTELRETQDTALFKYTDFLSYDRGYGSYKALLDNNFISGKSITEQEIPLYKLKIFSKDKCLSHKEEDQALEEFENQETSQIIPDYCDIDFSIYPKLTDSVNPMQRLWSDGNWMKAYLAHGCYWHKCSFCDVTLDYVKSYRMTQIEKLYEGLSKQCASHGVYGIHFVDEAMPPKAQIEFARLNMKNNSCRISFWGNVRFEKTYTRDVADFLSKGGLIGVSGGIEIATGSGLDKISKGTNLDSIVSACCAFKEAGILVHAYMIYGYFGESDQDIINSMETLRQLFKAGLVDSCFWHKFVLTRYSRLYDEWSKGEHRDLKVIEPENTGLFAKNGLHFEGEEKSRKFGHGLETSLNSWMEGRGIDIPVNQWFDFKTPFPTVRKDLVEKAISKYEEKNSNSSEIQESAEKLWWLAGPVIKKGNKLKWSYMQEIHSTKLPKEIDESMANDFISAVLSLSPQNHDTKPMNELFLRDKNKASLANRILSAMRGRGLVKL